VKLSVQWAVFVYFEDPAKFTPAQLSNEYEIYSTRGRVIFCSVWRTSSATHDLCGLGELFNIAKPEFTIN
jgi:hypothetical protein